MGQGQKLVPAKSGLFLAVDGSRSTIETIADVAHALLLFGGIARPPVGPKSYL
jgi:hypothetical protein